MSQKEILDGHFNQCVRESRQLFEKISKAVDRGFEYSDKDNELLKDTLNFISQIAENITDFSNGIIEKCKEEKKAIELFNEISKLFKN